MDELVYNTTHSLIEQSRSARFTSHLTNADGFGVGWYGTRDAPGVHRSVSQAWSDRNLQNLCAQIKSPLFLAHVRATTGTPVQQTNCHPFHHGRCSSSTTASSTNTRACAATCCWPSDPALLDGIEGTTDSELLFFLALTFGLEDEPLPALERMARFVEATGRGHGVDEPLQTTLGVSDGERLHAVRYTSGQVEPHTLHVSNDAEDVQLLSIPRTNACNTSPRRHARSSPSRWPTCRDSGLRYRRPRHSSSSRAPTSNSHLRHA